VVVFVLALVVVAAQLLAHWLLGNLPIVTFHPGYFLPTAAGAFIASIGPSGCGWHRTAQGAFGLGVFFWLSIGAQIFNCNPSRPHACGSDGADRARNRRARRVASTS
jgi:tellurite resistance protein TehA-like permease